MTLLSFFQWLNGELFALPATVLFLGAGIILTIKTGFLQIRAIPRFFSIIFNKTADSKTESHTINKFHALFTAMGTTIGMGNMVGPTIAIMIGGPSALFWLLLYMFFGAATKLSEVVFAIHTRTQTGDGYVIGGPMNYLKHVTPLFATWYASVMVFLFAGWSAIQANTLANIFALEHIPGWITGVILSGITLLVVYGGAHRVGTVASKLVPFMFILYVSFFFWIVLRDIPNFFAAIQLMLESVATPHAAAGGFVGTTILQAMRIGIYRGIHITEAGLGVSSIPHAIATVDRPIDQGILALFSTAADMFLSFISGIVVLMTGVWLTGSFRATLIYEAFKLQAPGAGSIILLISVSLFVITTVIGNSFNGIQTYGSLTNYRWTQWYLIFTALAIFCGSIAESKLAWEVMDTLITLVAIPNLIGILLLSYRYAPLLRY